MSNFDKKFPVVNTLITIIVTIMIYVVPFLTIFIATTQEDMIGIIWILVTLLIALYIVSIFGMVHLFRKRKYYTNYSYGWRAITIISFLHNTLIIYGYFAFVFLSKMS